MKKSTIRNKRKIRLEHYNPEEQNKKQRKFMSITYSRNVKLTIVSIFAILLTAMTGSYAYLSSVQKSEKYNTLTSGILKVDFNNTEEGMGDVVNLNGAYPESDSDGLNEQPYTFKITNTGTINAAYKVSLIDDADMIKEDQCSENLLSKDKIRVSVDGENAFTLSTKEADSYVVATGTLNANKSKVHNIRVWIDANSGNEVLGKHYHGKIVVDTVNTTDSDVNPHIKAVYRYNQNGTGSGLAYTGCLGGEEAGCSDVISEIDGESIYNAGDIVKYEVAPGVEKYFNVLYDNGSTLTMQQRENTIYSTAWYAASNDNSQGPTTVLPALEAATASWTNVKNQSYAARTTEFGTGTFKTANTACTWTVGATVNAAQCSGNTYPAFTKTNVKARMITANEAGDMNCRMYKSDGSANMSCKKFMNNYLYTSTTYGGTVEDDYHTGSDHNYGYWTMSADLSYSTNALTVTRYGTVFSSSTSDLGNGARAVVVVNK